MLKFGAMPKISPEGRNPEVEPNHEKFGKATAIAPANIALIKYWGNFEGNIPYSDTISFNLSHCHTTTTVSWENDLLEDQLIIDGKEVTSDKLKRVVAHLNRIRELGGIKQRARVQSKNSFPMGAGIASSASAFSALTLASARAAGLVLSEQELSALSRLGSGSASRSIPDGFVLWHKGKDHKSSYAESIFPPEYWDLRDFVVILETGEKEVGSSTGHKIAHTSPLFENRVSVNLPLRISRVLKALEEKNIRLLGETIEEEARELHEVARTSSPSIVYATANTLRLTDEIIPKWREDGTPAYFTLDAGPTVHLIVPGEYSSIVREKLGTDLPEYDYIENRPSQGAGVTEGHLF